MGKGDERAAFLHATMGAMDLVYNLSRRMTDTPEDAEDLVQDTYLNAYRAWVDRRRPRRVEPWIATICLNLGRSRARTRARRPNEVPIEEREFPSATAVDPLDAAIDAGRRDDLYRAMQGLNDDQRVAITLVDLAGLSTVEAATAMGTPRGTVLSRLHRGRRALAELLGHGVGDREERPI